MNLNRFAAYLVLLFGLSLMLSSCKTKKAVLKGKPGELVQPQEFVAESMPN